MNPSEKKAGSPAAAGEFPRKRAPIDHPPSASANRPDGGKEDGPD